MQQIGVDSISSPAAVEESDSFDDSFVDLQRNGGGTAHSGTEDENVEDSSSVGAMPLALSPLSPLQSDEVSASRPLAAAVLDHGVASPSASDVCLAESGHTFPRQQDPTSQHTELSEVSDAFVHCTDSEVKPSAISKSVLETLHKVKILRGLHRDCIDEIAKGLTKRSYAPGDVIVSEGEVCCVKVKRMCRRWL